MVQDWCRVGAEELEAAKESHYVQSVIKMNELSGRYISDSQNIAAALYTKWLTGALNSARP